MPADDPYADQLVDEERLREYLTATLGPAATFEVEHLGVGHSNETLAIEWGDRELVLRRPPAGETARTAHDVLREYRVITALENTDVPTPTPIAASEDPSIIGGDFYLMERLDGTVVRTEEPERFATPDRRRRMAEELVDTLAAIHTVDYEAVGLGDFGRPEGFLDRQIDRWGKQFEWAAETTADERSVPHVDEIGSWLEANVPEDYEHTLVHGDYKLDNVMYGPSADPDLIAVMDWEISTLGDPLRDIGWLCCFYDTDPLIEGLMPTFLDRPGYPDRRELLERYERQSGIEVVELDFYVVLGLYMLTAVCEMFYARYLNGNSDDPLYPTMERLVPEVSRRAKAIIEGERRF
jgi:aminoglycoside phosphotransferase (APT) family kinase protein